MQHLHTERLAALGDELPSTEEAAHLADIIAVLARGRITASGSHDDILEVAGAADLESAFLALTAEGAHS